MNAGQGDGEPPFSIVNCVSMLDQDALFTTLEQQGYYSLRLDGESITDKATLLRQVDNDFPHPSDLTPHNWDALTGVFVNTLLGLQRERVALVWTHVERIVQGDLQDFVDGVRILTDAARDLTTADSPPAMTVLLFLVGEGPQFRRLGARGVPTD